MARTPKPATAFSFGSAPQAPETKKPSSSSKLNQIELPGAADYAALVALEAAVITARKTLAADLEGIAFDKCVTDGCGTGIRPENWVGFEEGHTVTMTMARRGSNSALSDEEAEILDEAKIPYGTVVEQVETYIFNPELIANPVWRQQIETALSKIPGLPAEIIMKQQGISKKVVTDETINAIFKKEKEAAGPLLKLVMRFSPRAKFNLPTIDITPMLERAARVMRMPKLKELVLSAANDPASVDRKPSKKKAAA